MKTAEEKLAKIEAAIRFVITSYDGFTVTKHTTEEIITHITQRIKPIIINNGKTPTVCVCQKCGAEFNDDELTIVSYSEYPGASTQKEHVSPCCNSGYDYKD